MNDPEELTELDGIIAYLRRSVEEGSWFEIHPTSAALLLAHIEAVYDEGFDSCCGRLSDLKHNAAMVVESKKREPNWPKAIARVVANE